MGADENRFWFHAKRYGWGWGLPATWQGWLVMLAYLVSVVTAAVLLPPRAGLPVIIMLTVLFIIVVAFKGERPLRWRWGRRGD